MGMRNPRLVTGFYQKIRPKGFDEIALEYNVDDEIPFLKEFCNKKHRILDLACGLGRVTLPLKKGGFDVVGVDISPVLIREARKRAKESHQAVRYDVGDMCDLPYQNRSFDRVICMWNSFNHLLDRRDQKQAIAEMYRVLRNKGKAFVVCMNTESAAAKRYIKTKTVKGNIMESFLKGIKHHFYLHNRTSLQSLAIHSPFQSVAVRFKRINGNRRIVMILTRLK